LLAGGLDPATPAAAIAAGTLPDERVVTASVAELAEVVAAAQLAAPSLVVVGEVVRCREWLTTQRWDGLTALAAD
jgi:siroheme synthase